MRQGWKLKKLGELSDVITKGTTPTSVGFKFQNEGINFVKVESITQNGSFIKNKFGYISLDAHEALKRSQLDEGDILFSIAGALGRTAIVSKDILPANTNQALSIIRLKNNPDVLKQYVLSALTSGYAIEQIEKFKGGVAQQNLSLGQMKSFQIPIPPLQEQQQIVAILDKAFAAIDQAKANIEQNIVNAKELFQSKLNAVFSQTGDGWEEKKLSELFKLKSGDGLTAKNMNDGPHPVYGGNGIAGYHNDFNFQGPEIIIGRVGALCGNVRLIGEKFWLTDNAFRISEGLNEFDFEFVVYMLNYKNLRSFARQAAQPVISNSSLKDVVLSYPKNKSVQIELRQKIQGIEEQLELLKRPYSVKLESLEELKKSLLQKAFTGELTNKEVAV